MRKSNPVADISATYSAQARIAILHEVIIFVEMGYNRLCPHLLIADNCSEGLQEWPPNAPIAVQYVECAVWMLPQLWDNNGGAHEVKLWVLGQPVNESHVAQPVTTQEDYVAVPVELPDKIQFEIYVVIR